MADAAAAARLLKQELADANVERQFLDDRAEKHAVAVAEQEAQRAEAEARLRGAKAKRELDRMQKKQKQEDRVHEVRRERQRTKHVEELAAQRAIKDEERATAREEESSALAEGEALLAQQAAYAERERKKKWKTQEKADADLARKAAEVHRSTQKLAAMRMEDHGALTVLFRAIDIDSSGFIQPSELEWVLHAITMHGPLCSEGESILSAEYRWHGTRQFKRLLRDFDASVNGRISISGLRTWWDTKGISGLGLGCKALRVRKTGAGTAALMCAQVMKCIEKQTEMEAAIGIQTALRRRHAKQLFEKQKKDGTLPGSRRKAASKIQAFYRMRLARVRSPSHTAQQDTTTLALRSAFVYPRARLLAG